MFGLTGSRDRSTMYASCWSNARDAMFALDCGTGSVVDANPAAEELTGYLRRELIGMSWNRLYSPRDLNRTADDSRSGTIPASSFNGTYIRRKDGVLRPVAFSSSAAFESDGRSLVLYIAHDVTELEKQAHRLDTLHWALSAYAASASALSQADSSQGMLQTICEAITSESAYALAWVGIAEDLPGKPVRIVATSGKAKDDLNDLHVSWAEDLKTGQGCAGIAIRTGRVKIIDDSETSSEFLPWRDWARSKGIRSLVGIPLSVEDHWKGAMLVYAARPFAFEPVAIEVFEHLAKQIGHGLRALYQRELLDAERLHRSQAQQQLTAALSAMVSALVKAMETRDPYTAGHEGRVAEIAFAIGKELGWTEERLLGLRMAAMVHDIGKISVPIEILTKPSRLTAEEREAIDRHPETGYAILKGIPFSMPIADIMRQHHEKLDGSGYPQGLIADDILAEAKVLAVADIVEAMTSNRPYRSALALDTALQEIESQSGTLLDAEAVQACLRLFREKNYSLPDSTSF